MKKTLIIIIIISLNLYLTICLVSNTLNNNKLYNANNNIHNIDKYLVDNIFDSKSIEKFEQYVDLINNSFLSLNKTSNESTGEIFIFYDINDIKIDNAIIDIGKSRSGMTRDVIKYIVIHDTGNYDSKANAYSHYNYLKTDPGTSWHYTVDENNILHHIPDNEIAFHAGDGLRDYGNKYYNTIYNTTSITGGNKNGIGIETCVNEGSNYIKTLKNAAVLVQYLMNKYDIEYEDVKMHYDFSGKKCPYVIIQNGIWDDFLKYIKIVDYYKKYLKDYKIEFKPITNIDKNGKIINTNEIFEYAIKFTKDKKVFMKLVKNIIL